MYIIGIGQAVLELLTFRLCSHYTGSILGPVRKLIQYNVSDASGNRIIPVRSGVELFTLYWIDMFWISNFHLRKQHSLESKRVITRFRSKTGPIH